MRRVETALPNKYTYPFKYRDIHRQPIRYLNYLDIIALYIGNRAVILRHFLPSMYIGIVNRQMKI